MSNLNPWTRPPHFEDNAKMNSTLLAILLFTVAVASVAMIWHVVRAVFNEMSGPDEDKDITREIEDWREGK